MFLGTLGEKAWREIFSEFNQEMEKSHLMTSKKSCGAQW